MPCIAHFTAPNPTQLRRYGWWYHFFSFLPYCLTSFRRFYRFETTAQARQRSDCMTIFNFSSLHSPTKQRAVKESRASVHFPAMERHFPCYFIAPLHFPAIHFPFQLGRSVGRVLGEMARVVLVFPFFQRTMCKT